MAATELLRLGISVVSDYLINQCRKTIETKSKKSRHSVRKPQSVFQAQQKKQPDGKQQKHPLFTAEEHAVTRLHW
jgi:hypothetical protein